MATEKESKLGLLTAESVRVIAESIGISGIGNEGAAFLAEDITYRLKHLVQEAEKVRRHGKRKRLVCSDLDSALSMSNVEPVYGVSMMEGHAPFRHASGGGREIYFTEQKEVDLSAVVNDCSAKLPCDISLKAHWLSIDGVQPTLPENPPPITKENQKHEMLDVSLKTEGNSGSKRSNSDAEKRSKNQHKHKDTVKLKDLTTHELSVEQQFYYKEITESCVGYDETKRLESLQSLQYDPGLHQMLPRFVAFVTEGVKINVVQKNLALLIYLMRVVKALLDNQTIYLDKYLHDLLPSVMTCVVSRQLCLRPDMDNHWALRDFAARIVSQISRNYSNNTNNIQSRVTKKFSKAIQCEQAALVTQYGAIVGLGELGPEVIKSCLLPYMCILGNRIKSVNEGSALNSTDKVAAEHIKEVLMKFLPNVLKSFHDSCEGIEDFNIAYGTLGPLMYSMFHSKDKIHSLQPSAIHAIPSRPSLQIPPRPAQIVIQQSAPSTPSYKPQTPSLSNFTPRSLPSLPSTPSSSSHKLVFVTQSKPTTPSISAVPSSPMVKIMPSQSSGSPVISSALPSQKFVVIQGGMTTTSGDSSTSGGGIISTIAGKTTL